MTLKQVKFFDSIGIIEIRYIKLNDINGLPVRFKINELIVLHSDDLRWVKFFGSIGSLKLKILS